MNWTAIEDNKLVTMKEVDNLDNRNIALALGTTISSVKHRYLRIRQKNNEDQYHHPIEKIEELTKYGIITWKNQNILECHSGWGNMTKIYSTMGNVLSLDISEEKIEHIKGLNLPGVTAIKCDSELEIHNLVFHSPKFDIVDLDPYGFPSRYFPHVLSLISHGVLLMTFPRLGVQQINKIMIRHYKVFWDIDLTDTKEEYIQKIESKLRDFGFMEKKSIVVYGCREVDRMLRFTIAVEDASLCDLVGLKVDRNPKQVSE